MMELCSGKIGLENVPAVFEARGAICFFTASRCAVFDGLQDGSIETPQIASATNAACNGATR